MVHLLFLKRKKKTNLIKKTKGVPSSFLDIFRVKLRGHVRDDCIFVRSYDELLQEMKIRENEDIFVIGGGEIYKELLPYCHEALITKVDAVGGADTFFPDLDAHPDFVCVDEGEPIDDNGHTIRFTTYKNLSVQEL